MFGSVGTDLPDDDDSARARAGVVALRRLVLLTLAVEAWVVLAYHPYAETPARYAVAALGLTACALVGFGGRHARAATAVAALIELAVVASVFPFNANHQILALVWLALLLLVGRDEARVRADARSRPGAGLAAGAGLDPGDAAACLRAVRAIVIAGLVWAGVAKLLSGLWLGGEYLAYRIAIDPPFARVLGPLLADDELARLIALENRVGSGPFRNASVGLLVVSNATWLGEILLPLGLLVERTRWVALAGCLLLLAAIQAGAREIFFAGLMLGGLLLFARDGWLGRALPVIGAGYVVWLVQVWSGR